MAVTEPIREIDLQGLFWDSITWLALPRRLYWDSSSRSANPFFSMNTHLYPSTHAGKDFILLCSIIQSDPGNLDHSEFKRSRKAHVSGRSSELLGGFLHSYQQ